MGWARGRPGKGRQPTRNCLVEDPDSRQVTFSKRRGGLFKKVSELSALCGAHVAVVAFSAAGNAFAFGSPSVDAVLRRYAPDLDPAPAATPYDDDDDGTEELSALRRAAEQTRAWVEAERARIRHAAEMIERARPAESRCWWEADVEALGEAELHEFSRALERLMGNVRRRAELLLSTPPPPQQQHKRRKHS